MTQDLKPTIAARVRAARKAQGITQDALAEAVGRTTEAISNIERALSLPPLDLLQRIADTLGTSLADLIEQPQPGGSLAERAMLETKIRATAGRLPIEHLRVAAQQIAALEALVEGLER